MSQIRVLYIEDDDVQRGEICSQLKQRGFEVASFNNGREGLDALTCGAFDIILCDLNMPEIGGTDVLREAKKICPEAPFLILTAHGSIAAARLAIRQGALKFLLKPLEIETLEMSIYEALEHARLENELKQNLDHIEKKNSQLQAILDSSLACIVLVDTDHKIVSTNKHVDGFFDLDPSDLIGVDLADFIDKISDNFADPDKFLRLAGRLEKNPDIDHGATFSLNEMISRALQLKGQADLLISLFTSPVKDKNDNDVGMVWFFTDMTFFRSADEQMRLIIDSAPVPTLISQVEDGLILFANNELGNLMGITRDEILGKATIEYYYDKNDRARIIQRLKTEGFVEGYETRLVRPDGSIIWAIMSLNLTKLSGKPVILTGIADITLRKQAEEALIKERNFTDAILDTAGALVVVLANDGTIVRFNKACEKVSGYKFHEVQGKNFAELFILQEELEVLDERFKEIIATRKPVDGENYWKTKDGDKRLISWSNNLLVDDRGEVEFVIATGIDITDQRRAEDNLRLYRQLYLNSNDGIVILDKEGHYIESNPAHLRLTGFDPEEIRGKRIHEIMGLAQDNKLRHDLDTYGGYRGEVNLRRRDGSFLIADISAFPIRNAEGEIINYSGIGRDISRQKEAQEALRKRVWQEEGLAACSQALLTNSEPRKAISEALFHLMIATQSNHVYIFENFDDPQDGLCSRIVFESVDESVESPSDYSILKHLTYKHGFERWREALSQGQAISGSIDMFPECERQFFHQQNISHVIALPIFVKGEWYGFLGFDVCRKTEKISDDDDDIRLLRTASEMIGSFMANKQFEETLRVSEERFRNLVENARDIIFSLDTEGRFTYLSPQFEEVTGYTAAEFIGRQPEELADPGRIELMNSWIQEGFPEDSPQTIEEPIRYKNKNGQWRWMISNSSVIKDEDGNPLEIIGIAHDITEIKILLENLEKANQELRETQIQLVQSEKMASLGQLVAGIAHEINTPIGAVNSMHDSLVRAMDKLRNLLDDELREELRENQELVKYLTVIEDANKVIKSGTERVTTIVKRLRSFARLDEAELKTVDIHEGLEDTLTLIHHEIKHHIKVNREFGRVPPIACYPGRLNQVFLNLLNNARQAIGESGEITIKTEHRDGRVHISFTDNGSGIPANDLKRIFDPGFTTKGVGVGTGLGLSICFQIIQDHRGRIWADSEVGLGTTFHIELPTDLDKRLESDKSKN